MKSFLTKWSFSLFLVIGLTASAVAQKMVSGIVKDAANGSPSKNYHFHFKNSKNG